MERNQLPLEFVLSNGDGSERSFQMFLADFNIVTIRRVPVSSHGPATKLLRRLLAAARGADNETVRGFDIRSPDHPCETCNGPHIVYQDRNLITICDSGCTIYSQFGVVGNDRFFIIGSDRHIVDAGSIQEIDKMSAPLGSRVSSSGRIKQSPPDPRLTDQRDTAA